MASARCFWACYINAFLHVCFAQKLHVTALGIKLNYTCACFRCDRSMYFRGIPKPAGFDDDWPCAETAWSTTCQGGHKGANHFSYFRIMFIPFKANSWSTFHMFSFQQHLPYLPSNHFISNYFVSYHKNPFQGDSDNYEEGMTGYVQYLYSRLTFSFQFIIFQHI